MNLIFDIETDGLYDDVTKVHCIGIHDLDANESYAFNDEGSAQPISKGVQLLEDAKCIIGHNVIGYDIPVLQKLYGWFKPSGMVIDTLLLSRLYHTDMVAIDKRRVDKVKREGRSDNMPVQLYGRHSLEAYGYRLKEYKGGFAKQTDWKEWSQDMQDYMMQDVNVTKKLWAHFQKYLSGSY